MKYTMKKEEKTKLWNYYGSPLAINDLFESIANKYGMNFYELPILIVHSLELIH